MKILGISAFYHDSAAAVIHDGEIIAAAQEERFTRVKNDASFPSNAIRFCLQYSGFPLEELDAIVFYDKPFLKFERLLETYYAYAPSGLWSFLRSMPVWIKEKLFLKKVIHGELKKIGSYDKGKLPLLFPEHHLSHAASAFYPSPFGEAAILTLDGVGEWATVSIGKGNGAAITILKELSFPHSLGLLYSAFTYYCGFAVNSGEYKLMGLAPYGDKDSEECRRMVGIIKTTLADLREDGSIFLQQEYFDYATGSRMVKDGRWEKLFGFGRRKEDGPLEACYCNMALAIQQVTEEAVLRLAAEARRLTGCEDLCLAGGVALNCVANGKLHEAGLFKRIFIQPAAGDAGGALGAALAAHYIYFGKERGDGHGGRDQERGDAVAGKAGPDHGGTGEGASAVVGADAMKGSCLGPEFAEAELVAVARKYGAVYRKMESLEALTEATARMIDEGKVVGWFQGRMEFGPRALGARSILADARNPEMQKKLNLSIKYREGFRPFAPAVLAEDVGDYFEVGGDFSSPYMLLVRGIKRSRRHPLPEGYAGWSMTDKLSFVRSDLPAITHVDHSARIQTVDRQTHPRFWQLLSSFRELTGCAVLINTSFNTRDEPIVNTPEEAYHCLMRTGMDWLVMGDLIFDKRLQPLLPALPLKGQAPQDPLLQEKGR
jgi:carbamoyltransferase